MYIRTPASFLNYAQRLTPRDWPFYSKTLGGKNDNSSGNIHGVIIGIIPQY